MRRRKQQRRGSSKAVFINIPYDAAFENKYLAYIAALTALGFVPHATLEIPSSQRRLDRIFKLIQSCPFSVHDLSRVQRDRAQPRTPRFNIPFELGLAVAWQMAADNRHRWHVCEAKQHRLAKSLSDLNGTDPHIHGDRVLGVCAALGNIFRRRHDGPTVQEMYRLYLVLRRALPQILHIAGTRDPFTARVFSDLLVVARTARARISQPPSTSPHRA